AGYGVVMMDARAHGASEGQLATYGWLERNDTRAILDALILSEVGRSDEPLKSGQSRMELATEADLKNPVHSPNPRPGTPHIFALGESVGAGMAVQSAGVEPRIEAVVAESSFATLREASYDYAGLRRSPLLGKTLFAPGTWTMIYHAERLAELPASEFSPEKAVAARAFPVLLICDADDVALPCRHTTRIYEAARGPKKMWIVPAAFHPAALGYEPAEFRRRVLGFYDSVR